MAIDLNALLNAIHPGFTDEEPAADPTTGLVVTFFNDYAASTKRQETLTLDELAELIRNTTAPTKQQLPWLKFAVFGEEPSERGSLRYNENVRELTGILVDYDGEKMSFDEAVECLNKASIRAIVYTSPSHLPEKPHWRIGCPVSRRLPPDQHYQMVSRLNGLFGGILAPESWTLSQSYYYGAVNGNPAHRVTVVNSAFMLDECYDLDKIAIGKPNNGNGRAYIGGPPEAPIEDIRAALEVIPNEDLPWDEWSRVGMAIFRASGGSKAGYAVFARWSRKSKKFDTEETRFRWRHFYHSPPDKIGAGALFHMAREACPGWVSPSYRKRVAGGLPGGNGDGRGDEGVAGAGGGGGDQGEVAGGGEEVGAGAPKYRFKIIPFNEIRWDAKPRYLVEGLIPRRGLACIWGPPKCGKSFVALDIAMHVALGWEYGGREVEAGPVLYVACEGQFGFPARVEAFKQTKLTGYCNDVPSFYLLPTRLKLVTDCGQLVSEIKAQLGVITPIMIVVDTLNRSLEGSESKDEDMGAYLAAIEHLSDEFNCLIILVHHSGVDRTRPRGHTALSGTVDAQIAVKSLHNDRAVATVELMKDGPEGEQLFFKRRVVEIGRDDRGDIVSSCVVDLVDAPKAGLQADQGATTPSRQKLAKSSRIALDLLRAAINEKGKIAPINGHIPPGTNCVDTDTWREYCYRGGISEGTAEARRKAFHRAKSDLIANGYVLEWDSFVWPAT
jgi:hypothetical protein